MAEWYSSYSSNGGAIMKRFLLSMLDGVGPRREARRKAVHYHLISMEVLESRHLLATDFGDAPIPYPTLSSEHGARHEAVGPTLGINRDAETDGVHSTSADADDNTGLPDDEDGVTFGSIRVGQLGATVMVVVGNAPSGARLDAWIDFSGDRSWGGPLEQVANNVLVVNGVNTLAFDVPATASAGTAFARFRISTAGNLGIRGAAIDGEVEDHLVVIDSPVVASGVFGSRQHVISPHSGPNLPLSVFAADMDGDGDTDLLSASLDDRFGTEWYENDGKQNFTRRDITGPGTRRGAVSAADMDGDGDMDVVSAEALGGYIDWYENQGNGGFSRRRVSLNSPGVESVFVSDMDGDGDLDVLSAAEIGNKIAWYENEGNQQFMSRTISENAIHASSVYAADVDGDGDTDVLSASVDDDKIAWYENDGNQNFALRVITEDADSAWSVYAADVDGDGDTDVLSASLDDDKIAWYENDGNQNFTARNINIPDPDSDPFNGTDGNANGARWVSAADMDGDGDTDVISASQFDNKIAWYENDGNQNFTARTISNVIFRARAAAVADVDGDGDLDVVSASYNGNFIAWHENLGVFEGDFNADGDYDCQDINALSAAVATNGSIAQFDLDNDNTLSLSDVSTWLALAGNTNLATGNPYLPGDANLDAVVDGSDFGIWNANKFTRNANWCDGNFDANRDIDGSDFGVWNANKFTSADAAGRSSADMPFAITTNPVRPAWVMSAHCRWPNNISQQETVALSPRWPTHLSSLPILRSSNETASNLAQTNRRQTLRRDLKVDHESREWRNSRSTEIDTVMAGWSSLVGHSIVDGRRC
jgi:FG-GAP-like repeat/GEVED domain